MDDFKLMAVIAHWLIWFKLLGRGHGSDLEDPRRSPPQKGTKEITGGVQEANKSLQEALERKVLASSSTPDDQRQFNKESGNQECVYPVRINALWSDSIVTSGTRKKILLRHHGPSSSSPRGLGLGDDGSDGGYLLTGTAMRMFEISKLQIHGTPDKQACAYQKIQGRQSFLFDYAVKSSLGTMPPPRRVIHPLTCGGLAKKFCTHNSESTSQIQYGLDGKSETVNSFTTPRKFPVHDEPADSSKPHASKQEICMCLRRNNPSIRLE
ncbi:hypothetical protein V8B97DRAFT_1915954 [Scleroderma yunnanense]